MRSRRLYKNAFALGVYRENRISPCRLRDLRVSVLELLRKTDTTEARRTRKKLFFGSLLVTIVLAILLSASTAFAQTSSFTYQGRLTDGGTAANGNYDLQFALFDSLSGGAQL